MHIVIDENIPQAQVFDQFGRVTRLPGRGIEPADVRDADALIVRSVSRVDEHLLSGSRVRFVGTCTIGTDHLDTDYLQAQGIGWANAPGCNAMAVVEYVLSVLQVLVLRTGQPLEGRCFGIVGVGQVGERLARCLQALGFDVLLCDPPREHEEKTSCHTYVGLGEILARCDVISLHVPLQQGGSWPTLHMLSTRELASLRPGCWLINAARGPVVDNAALLDCLRVRSDLAVVLDVWEHEPDFDPGLLAYCQLATPHIAGYSLDGKIRGTEMIFREFCRHFALMPASEVVYPEPMLQAVVPNPAASAQELLTLLAGLLYEPCVDDAAMRRLSGQSARQRQQGFDLLRKNYPVRRELGTLSVLLPDCTPEQQRVLSALQPQGW